MPKVTGSTKGSAFVSKILAPSLGFAAVLGTFLFYHHPAPDVRTVNGTYTSTCCGVVEIMNGMVSYQGQSSKLKLIHDKFGLAGYLTRPIGQLYLAEGGAQKPVVFVFDDHSGFSVVDHHNRTVYFRRDDGRR